MNQIVARNIFLDFYFFFFEKILIWTKFFPKSEQNHAKYHLFTQNFAINLDNSSKKKNEFQRKTFLFSNFTLNEFCNDTTNISLRWANIDRPILSEPQKNPIEYIVPPPQVGSEQLIPVKKQAHQFYFHH